MFKKFWVKRICGPKKSKKIIWVKIFKSKKMRLKQFVPKIRKKNFCQKMLGVKKIVR